MLCKTYCGACIGINAITITIEVSISQGISFFLVGLPDSAVKESQQRITTALASIGARIPGKKVVVNMAPADFRKEGASFDLAIAVGILAASEQYSFGTLNNYMIMGELALDGSLRKVHGALPIALHAKNKKFKGCIFPVESADELAGMEGIAVYAARDLPDVISILNEEGKIMPLFFEDKDPEIADTAGDIPDFSDIKGHEFAKRGMEIAAAGGHNIMMCGGSGSGKSMIAKALAGILPAMGWEESLETSMIYSVAGISDMRKGLISKRPFRTPHHSSSAVAIIGGGIRALPGEISLSHNGVLYLDELAEYPRSVLEVLRQPMEDKIITISRQRYKLTYPCDFMLVASMNPCPCGYYGQPGERCRCQAYSISRYLSKISGPLLDRIDIHIEMSPVSELILLSGNRGEPSSVIAKRVKLAREIQQKRYGGKINSNARMGNSELNYYCRLGDTEQVYLGKILRRYRLSSRACVKILKVSRTIADLDGTDFISLKHLSEAVQYRGIGKLYGYE